MKINLTEEMKERSELSHIILSCMSDVITDSIIKTGKNKDGNFMCDVKFTVNEHELDIKSFIDNWQSKVSKIIRGKATELMKEKFSDLSDLFYDLEERLNDEIEKRMEDWEK